MKRAIAAVTAALLGLAGCTSSGDGDDPAPTGSRTPATSAAVRAELRSAAEATGRAGSARVEATTGVGDSLAMTSEGALAWDDGLTGTLTLTYTGGTLADTMRELGTESMEARYLPDAYYARMGDAFAARAGGRHWVRYPWAELDRLGGSGAAHLSEQIRGATPDRSVRFLLAAPAARVIGEERVRGIRTTHYTATSQVSDLGDPALREQLERAGVTTRTVDIWVDERDLVVKKAEKGRSATGELTQTAYYDGYGTEVAVREPPAADTQDFKELLATQGTGR
ncbi:hypothetical protein ACIQNG_01230 [Streptomyces sp. NPDC091377]|uniref:hypothetical protein n=1 Tax=Streptomyces sp. NPDC091377 TaxID=3365995 RepID=UPI003824430A